MQQELEVRVTSFELAIICLGPGIPLTFQDSITCGSGLDSGAAQE